ncbi:MAG: response regulator [Defluviitaleaceae bacterium]|nr:response regulator [Defluviitaleaceae bacterium]
MELKKNSILIVDDQAINIKILTHMLSQDYTIYAESDGGNCFDAAKRLQPDLILLDVIMPGKSGFDIIKELKEAPATQNIPVIFVTGLDDSEEEAQGLLLGAVDYIKKPFTASGVKRCIMRHGL